MEKVKEIAANRMRLRRRSAPGEIRTVPAGKHDT